ncbi:broad-range acid phosphatase Det1p [Monosporozyma unispora]|nr:acid phosphatase det1 [Kazachstania unispora]
MLSIPTAEQYETSPRRRQKPRLVVLIRHGESESNINKSVNEYTPNQLIPLTEKGWTQAHNAGVQLLKVLNLDDNKLVNEIADKYEIKDEKVCKGLPLEGYKPLSKDRDTNIVFYTSPYRRTRETLRGVLDVMDEYNFKHSNVKSCPDGAYQPTGKQKYAVWPWGPETSGNYTNSEATHDLSEKLPSKDYIRYRVKDEPRLREQDFGNFQEVSSMKDVLEKRKTYGHFFFRFPQGESAADVYDRVASFQETLFRHFEERESKKIRDVIVLVTHGIYSRVFLMKWFRWTYEEFESFTNVPNGCVIVMELDEETDRYILRTKLPKWDYDDCSIGE